MKARWIITTATIVLLCASLNPLRAQTVFARGSDNAAWMTEGGGDWTLLGGVLGGAPDACRSGNDLVVVARGTDDAVWMNRRNGGTWTGWTSLGGTITSDVSVACMPDGSARVFARGSDSAVWTRSAAADDWSSLGGQVRGGPEASASSSGTIDVVVRGGDDAVWHIGWNGSAWSDWRSLGGRTHSDPTIARLTAARADVVITNSDGIPQQATLTASGAVSWHTLDGIVRGSADLTSAGDGRADLVARGTDNAVWKNSYDGTRWIGWSTLGGVVSSDPGATAGTATVVSSGATVTAVPASPAPAPAPARARFIVEVLGFSVERQTVDNLLNTDGWADEVYQSPGMFSLAADGSVSYNGGAFSSVMGQRTDPQTTQAGSAQANGGLRNGDSFPTDPLRGPLPGALSVLFSGELTAGSGGAVLIPSLWEWDGRQELLPQFHNAMEAASAEVARRAAALFASMRGGSDLSRFVRDGNELGLSGVVRWPGAPGPMDYPIGVVRTPAGMTFTPKAILLTYETAEYIRSRRFNVPVITPLADHGAAVAIDTQADPGVFAVRYMDEGDGFAGDYTLYFKVTRD